MIKCMRNQMQNFKTFCKFLLEMPSVYNHKSRRETRTRGHLWSEAWELPCPPAGFPGGSGQGLPSAGEAPSRGTGWTPRPATSLSGPRPDSSRGGAMGGAASPSPELVDLGPHGQVETAFLSEDPTGRCRLLPPLGAGTYFTRGSWPLGQPRGTEGQGL